MELNRIKMTFISLLITACFFSFQSSVNAQKPGTAKHEGKICEVTSYSMNKICK